MHTRQYLQWTLVCMFVLLQAGTVRAGEIFFPSCIDNGSFEEWSGNHLLDWEGEGWIHADPAEPFIGQYAVLLDNVMPWEGYLYQEFPYRSRPILFGFACRSRWEAGDKIIVRYFDAGGGEISFRRWDSHAGNWQVTFEVLHPPAGTASIRVELIPMLDGIGFLYVDHVFMIPAQKN